MQSVIALGRITMSKNTLSTSPKPIIYRLEGRPLRQWWQMSDFFALAVIPKKSHDRYKNATIRSQLAFVLSIPFYMVLHYRILGHADFKLDAFIGAAGLATIAMLIGTFKEHRKTVLAVQQDADGLTLISALFKRRIGWAQIRALFQLANDDYVLETSNGDEFILSCDLTDRDLLLHEIKDKAPKFPESFDLSYRVPNDAVDGLTMVCFAITLAALASTRKFFLQPGPFPTSEILSAVGIAISIIVPIAIIWRFLLTRAARMVRIGSTSCAISTGTGRHVLRFDEISLAKRFGPYVFVKSESGLFMIASEKNEPTTNKLLTQTQNKLIS
jgi:hypothetical protein